MLRPFRRRARGAAKLPIVLALLALVFVALPLAVIKSHSHRVYGGYVERVDPSRFQLQQQHIAITDVSVLSPDGEAMLPNRLVVIDEGRIVSIAENAAPPAGARIVEGRGKFLIPGLIDAHVHLRKQPNDLLLYVANGVTHVRDLAGSEADLKLREEIEQGRIGPRLHVASPMLFSAGLLEGALNAFFAPRLNAGGPDRAEEVVTALIDAGYDAIKTYADLDIDSYRAINRIAAERGMYTIGHLPDGFELGELATTQQQELAHVEEIIKLLQREFHAQGRDDYGEAFPEFVAGRADAVIDDLLANDITVNSTLWLAETIGDQVFGLKAALKRLPLEYANPAMVEGSAYVPDFGWLPGTNQFEASSESSAEARERVQSEWDARAEAHRVLFRRMVERDVRITAGTDATSHLVIPGFSMHDELESLVRNGMRNAEALRSATATPAGIMGTDDGVLAPGRQADLVLLSADPLKDIRNTRAIEAVALAGRFLDRAMLEKMLAAVARAHAASRSFDLAAYE